MNLTVFIICLFAFLAGTLFLHGVLQLWKSFRPTDVEDRLRALGGGRSADAAPGLLKDEELAIEVGDKLRSFARVIVPLNVLIRQSGVSISKKVLLGLSASCAAFAVPIAILAHVPAPLVPLAVVGSGVMPIGYLCWRRRRRLKAFAEQFPDALEMLARALRAGNSLPTAIRVIADEMLPPLSEEFALVCEANNLGVPLEKALAELDERMPSPEVRFFTTCVRVQQRSGGNLAEVLEKISGMVRDRFRVLGQVQALTAEGRLTGAILLSLPIVMFIAVYYLSPGYVAPLFEDEIGRKMIAYTAGLQILGAIAIKKIVAIKV